MSIRSGITIFWFLRPTPSVRGFGAHAGPCKKLPVTSTLALQNLVAVPCWGLKNFGMLVGVLPTSTVKHATFLDVLLRKLWSF